MQKRSSDRSAPDPDRRRARPATRFAPRDIPSVVQEYMRAAHEAGLREVRLIHGRGRGVQRGIVQSALETTCWWCRSTTRRNPHLGATVALLIAGPPSSL